MIMNDDEYAEAVRDAARLGGLKCVWCAVVMLENSTRPGAELWTHHLCSECRRWVEIDAVTAVATDEYVTPARDPR
jgi:hypothetical protein